MWKILTAASTAFALLGAPAFAQMTDFDADDDAMIDRDEFDTGFGEGGVFGDWDDDDDLQLTEDEWDAGFGDSFDEERFGAFSDWDADASGFLDETEFNEGVFGAYDEDDDDLWGDTEFGVYEDEGLF
jgi:hypothetical protein